MNLPSASEPAVRRFAALRLANVSLLLPLQEIHSLESCADVDRSRKEHGGAGALRHGAAWLSVLSLSDDLELQSELPAEYRICALLANDATLLAVACAGISSIDGSALSQRALPLCMHSVDSPVLQLANAADQVYCSTSVAALSRFLEQAA